MASYLNFTAERDSFLEKVESKAADLFNENLPESTPPLRVSRIFRTKLAGGHEAKISYQKGQPVWNLSQLKQLRKDSSNDSCQIFVISQPRIFKRMNIGRQMFQGLMDAYEVMPDFWKCVFAFGKKDREKEFDFPHCRPRITRCGSDGQELCQELNYVLRRVELNHRGDDQPWSIRQTGVYHKLKTTRSLNRAGVNAKQQSTFLLIAPSACLEDDLAQSIEMGCRSDAMSKSDSAVAAWNLHRLLVESSLRGWMSYMSWIEEELKAQSRPIVFAGTVSKTDNLSPLKDYTIGWETRQNLKMIEDQIMELQVILETMQNTIKSLREQCKAYTNNNANSISVGERCDLEFILSEFDEFLNEAEIHCRRAKVLKESAVSTTKLWYDLLSYEQAVGMKELAIESHDESKSMMQLTKRTTKDSAAMNIITIITLIYLPTTIVANFFSTQFVQTNDLGHMKLSGSAWLLAAISIPLTAATILVWWAWVSRTKSRIQESLPVELKDPSIARNNSFRSVFPLKKKKKTLDLEGGGGGGGIVSAPTSPAPPSFHDSGVGTWSTIGTAKSATSG